MPYLYQYLYSPYICLFGCKYNKGTLLYSYSYYLMHKLLLKIIMKQ